VIRLCLLVGVLCAFGILTPCALRVFGGAPTPERIVVAVLLLFPIGLGMGMAFPLGMNAASARDDAATPWLWGVNGATSVCASVLAVAVAMSAGISAAYWSGVVCYGIAAAAFALAIRTAAAGAERGTAGYAGRTGAPQVVGAAAGTSPRTIR
jgi:hypothetical protein